MIPDDEVRDTAGRLLSHPLHFPDEFKTYLADFVALNIPLIPFSHIFGSRINIARSGDYIPTSETGTSGSYHDLATVGPQLTNIADGSYLVVYGASCRDRASISVNGATPSDDDAIWATEAQPRVARMKIVSLSSDNTNSIKMQYKGTRGWSHRWLIIIRLGAP